MAKLSVAHPPRTNE